MLLTDDQIMIRDAVRAFAQEQLWPNAAKWDREHHFPVEAHRGLAELGAYGICVPEELGGALVGAHQQHAVVVVPHHHAEGRPGGGEEGRGGDLPRYPHRGRGFAPVRELDRESIFLGHYNVSLPDNRLIFSKCRGVIESVFHLICERAIY